MYEYKYFQTELSHKQYYYQLLQVAQYHKGKAELYKNQKQNHSFHLYKEKLLDHQYNHHYYIDVYTYFQKPLYHKWYYYQLLQVVQQYMSLSLGKNQKQHSKFHQYK
jgi:hypothetical protein